LKKLSLYALAIAAVIAFGSLAVTASADEATYTIDADHSSINFKVRHLLTKTTGEFHTFNGTIVIDPDKRDSVKVDATIDTASLDTDEDDRDKHLRSADFFDVEKYPKMTFSGGELTDTNKDRTRAKLKGQLTMHGVTKPVVLNVEWYGTVTDPWGNKKAGFAGFTTINRKDFGIIWNKTLDAGGLMVGDTVEVEIQVEGNLKED